MPVIVTGTFILPDGEVAADRDITIRRRDRQLVVQDGQIIVPDDIFARTDSTGQIMLDILPGNYAGFAKTATGQSASFTMAVPDVEEIDAGLIVGAAAIPPTPPPNIPIGEAGQVLAFGSNGQLTAINPQQASVSISSDSSNALQFGADGGLYVFETIGNDGGLDLTVLFDNQII